MALFVSGFVCQRISKFAQNKANRDDIIRHEISISARSIPTLYALSLCALSLCYAFYLYAYTFYPYLYTLYLYKLYLYTLYPYAIRSILVRRFIPMHSIIVHSIPCGDRTRGHRARVNKSYISTALPILDELLYIYSNNFRLSKWSSHIFFSIQSTSINAVCLRLSYMRQNPLEGPQHQDQFTHDYTH